MLLPSHEPKIIEQHFKMGNLRYLKFVLKHPNLKDPCFSVPLNKESRNIFDDHATYASFYTCNLAKVQPQRFLKISLIKSKMIELDWE